MAEDLTLEVDNNEFQNDLEMENDEKPADSVKVDTKLEKEVEEKNKDLEVGELPESPDSRVIKRKGRGFEKSKFNCCHFNV